MSINKNETICVTYTNNSKATHIITRNNDVFFLYEMVNSKPVKTKHKSDNPIELEKWIFK